MKTVRVVTVSLLVLVGLASAVEASTITLEYRGVIGNTPLAPDVPAGSLLRVIWTRDTDAPNLCVPPDFPGQAMYGGQQVTVHVGNFVYTATGYLMERIGFAAACDDVDRRESLVILPGGWTGPNLTNVHLVGYDGGLGMPMLAINQGIFYGPLFTGNYMLTTPVTLQPVPEPSTLLLAGSILLAGIVRLRRSLN